MEIPIKLCSLQPKGELMYGENRNKMYIIEQNVNNRWRPLSGQAFNSYDIALQVITEIYQCKNHACRVSEYSSITTEMEDNGVDYSTD